jgi:hypothetical protein
LSIDFGINGRQDCKTGTVGSRVHMRRGKVNGGDEGERTWLMDSIYIYEIV